MLSIEGTICDPGRRGGVPGLWRRCSVRRRCGSCSAALLAQLGKRSDAQRSAGKSRRTLRGPRAIAPHARGSLSLAPTITRRGRCRVRRPRNRASERSRPGPSPSRPRSPRSAAAPARPRQGCGRHNPPCRIQKVRRVLEAYPDNVHAAVGLRSVGDQPLHRTHPSPPEQPDVHRLDLGGGVLRQDCSADRHGDRNHSMQGQKRGDRRIGAPRHDHTLGVAQYLVSPALPEQLRSELPTVEDLASEYPALSLLKLRMEIEGAVRDFAAEQGVPFDRLQGIGPILQELERRGLAPASAGRLLDALKIMNQAVHGLSVEPASAEQAIHTGAEFLIELSRLTR